jgi:hypothetical protein
MRCLPNQPYYQQPEPGERARTPGSHLDKMILSTGYDLICCSKPGREHNIRILTMRLFIATLAVFLFQVDTAPAYPPNYVRDLSVERSVVRPGEWIRVMASAGGYYGAETPDLLVSSDLGRKWTPLELDPQSVQIKHVHVEPILEFDELIARFRAPPQPGDYLVKAVRSKQVHNDGIVRLFTVHDPAKPLRKLIIRTVNWQDRPVPTNLQATVWVADRAYVCYDKKEISIHEIDTYAERVDVTVEFPQYPPVVASRTLRVFEDRDLVIAKTPRGHKPAFAGNIFFDWEDLKPAHAEALALGPGDAIWRVFRDKYREPLRLARTGLGTIHGIPVDDLQSFANALFVDAKHRVWACSAYKVVRLTQDRWTVWGEDDGLPGKNLRVQCLGGDRSGKVWSWISSEWEQYSLCVHEDDTWRVVLDSVRIADWHYSWLCSGVHRLDFDGAGLLWLASGDAVARYDPPSQSLTIYGLPFQVKASAPDVDKGVWLVDGCGRLSSFDGDRLVLHSGRDLGVTSGSYDTVPYIHVVQDKYRRVYVTTPCGVSRLAEGTWEYVDTAMSPTVRRVCTMIVDSKGRPWVSAAGVERGRPIPIPESEWQSLDDDVPVLLTARHLSKINLANRTDGQQ